MAAEKAQYSYLVGDKDLAKILVKGCIRNRNIMRWLYVDHAIQKDPNMRWIPERVLEYGS